MRQAEVICFTAIRINRRKARLAARRTLCRFWRAGLGLNQPPPVAVRWSLEHFQKKWMPVFRQKMRPLKKK
jgi:hypothetical protein